MAQARRGKDKKRKDKQENVKGKEKDPWPLALSFSISFVLRFSVPFLSLLSSHFQTTNKLYFSCWFFGSGRRERSKRRD